MMAMIVARNTDTSTTLAVSWKRSRIIAVTGSPVAMEVPRSPFTALPNQSRELHRQRLVQAHLVMHLRQRRRIGAFAQHHLRRIAGDETDQSEDHDAHQQQRGNGQRQCA